MSKIIDIIGREILDSRGNPTVEAQVCLQGGCVGLASVPSGSSVGSKEYVELRDNDPSRFCGKGVITAVHAINGPIRYALLGKDAREQNCIDDIMINLDGTKNKSKLGANAILSVSLAVAKAAASFKLIPLYEYISIINGTPNQFSMPLPMMNIVNGGKHANNSLDIQEFMIQPIGACSIKEAIRIGVEIFHNLSYVLREHNYEISFGDEGGYAPNVDSHIQVLSLIEQAVHRSGYIFGKDIILAIDCAASEFFDKSTGLYYLKNEKKFFTFVKFVNYLSDLVARYPIKSIEDGLSEYDWKGFQYLTQKLGSTIQLVGDDLFVTNINLLKKGIDMHAANSILIKPNQIGSLTETLAVIRLAKDVGYNTIISHRSGETEDTTIADLAVGTCAGQIKTGSLRCSDRVAKYNQLIRIEEYLGGRVRFDRFYKVN